MLRSPWLLAPVSPDIYSKCGGDVLNIWGRGSVTRPWITGDCSWVTESRERGFSRPRRLPLLISLANRLWVAHSCRVCHCCHQPSVFILLSSLSSLSVDGWHPHLCWLFSVFWWQGHCQLRLSINYYFCFCQYCMNPAIASAAARAAADNCLYKLLIIFD